MPSWTDTRDYMTEVDLDDIDILKMYAVTEQAQLTAQTSAEN